MKNKNNTILTITVFVVLAILLCLSWLTFDPADSATTTSSEDSSAIDATAISSTENYHFPLNKLEVPE
ncbi:MAG: hypothetical protein PUH88_09595 [Lachnospiraceae bacterium]|nr:hypothetical protein [Lachnospiraceae bacterium]